MIGGLFRGSLIIFSTIPHMKVHALEAHSTLLVHLSPFLKQVSEIPFLLITKSKGWSHRRFR